MPANAGPGWAGWNQILPDRDQNSMRGLMQYIAQHTGPQNDVRLAPFQYIGGRQVANDQGGVGAGGHGYGQGDPGGYNYHPTPMGDVWKSPYGAGPNSNDPRSATNQWDFLFKQIYGVDPSKRWQVNQDVQAKRALNTGQFQQQYLPGGGQYDQHWLKAWQDRARQGQGDGGGGGGGQGNGGGGGGQGGGGGGGGGQVQGGLNGPAPGMPQPGTDAYWQWVTRGYNPYGS